jgi:hypothetical protein
MVFPTFYWSSLVIPILMLFPNFLCFLFPPINTPQFKEKNEPLILLILENIGRIGVTVIPLFYPIILNNTASYFYLTCSFLLLFFYYTCWLRFFRFRNYAALFLPMGHIPIPMAVSPVLFFLVSAVILHSLPMFVAAILLASGHLPLSYKKYQRIILQKVTLTEQGNK